MSDIDFGIPLEELEALNEAPPVRHEAVHSNYAKDPKHWVPQEDVLTLPIGKFGWKLPEECCNNCRFISQGRYGDLLCCASGHSGYTTSLGAICEDYAHE